MSETIVTPKTSERITQEVDLDTTKAVEKLDELVQLSDKVGRHAEVAGDQIAALFKRASEISKALADLPARLDALTTQAGLLAGQVSAAQPIEVGELHLDGPIWTRRDLAAHAALTGLLPIVEAPRAADFPDWIARRAYELADAMELAAEAPPRDAEAAR